MRKLGTVEPGAAIEGVYVASAAYIAASGGKLTATNNTVKETILFDTRDKPATVHSYVYQNDSGDIIVAPQDRDADLTAVPAAGGIDLYADSSELLVAVAAPATGTANLGDPITRRYDPDEQADVYINNSRERPGIVTFTSPLTDLASRLNGEALIENASFEYHFIAGYGCDLVFEAKDAAATLGIVMGQAGGPNANVTALADIAKHTVGSADTAGQHFIERGIEMGTFPTMAQDTPGKLSIAAHRWSSVRVDVTGKLLFSWNVG